MLMLNKQVSVIMMKKDNNGKYLSKLNKDAKKILTAAFGGVTISTGSGTWLDSGVLFEDKNYIFHCNYTDKLTDKQKAALIEVIKMEFLRGDQKAVSIMLGSSLAILDRGDLKQLESEFQEIRA